MQPQQPTRLSLRAYIPFPRALTPAPKTKPLPFKLIHSRPTTPTPGNQPTQSGTNIKPHRHLVPPQRLLVVSEVLAAVDGAVADNIDGEEAVREGGQLLQDLGAIDRGAHVDGVVAPVDDEAGQEGGTDGVVLDGEVEGDVALLF